MANTLESKASEPGSKMNKGKASVDEPSHDESYSEKNAAGNIVKNPLEVFSPPFTVTNPD